jgi:hypothetical protein
LIILWTLIDIDNTKSQVQPNYQKEWIKQKYDKIIQYHKDKRLPQRARLELEIRRAEAKTKWKGTPIEYCMILYIIQNIFKISQTPYIKNIPDRSPPAEKSKAKIEMPHTAPHNGHPRTKPPHSAPCESKHQHTILRNTIMFIGLILLIVITLKHITQGKNAIALGAALACGGHGTADSIHDMIPNRTTKQPSAQT